MDQHQSRLILIGLLPSVYKQKARWSVIKRLEDEFTIRGPLGAGSSSVVLLADMKARNNKAVVLKIYKAPDASEGPEVDTLVSIERITAGLGQENINSILEFFIWRPMEESDVPDILIENEFVSGRDYVVYALEYIRGQDFLSLIKRYWHLPIEQQSTKFPIYSQDNDFILSTYSDRISPDPKEVKKLLIGVLKALTFLHSFGFAHRDVKPENIRVRETTGDPVLLDFGFSCNLEYENVTSELLSCQRRKTAGTPVFLSPEIFSQTAPTWQMRMAADVWAAAMVFAFLVNGYRPMGKIKTIQELVMALRQYQGPPPIIYVRDKKINSLLRLMLEKDWNKRIYAILALQKLLKMNQIGDEFTEQEIEAAMLDPLQKNNVVPCYVKSQDRELWQTVVDDTDQKRIEATVSKSEEEEGAEKKRKRE